MCPNGLRLIGKKVCLQRLVLVILHPFSPPGDYHVQLFSVHSTFFVLSLVKHYDYHRVLNYVVSIRDGCMRSHFLL